jgi:large subunit ribosomal protein L6
MGRIGKRILEIPDKVEIKMLDGAVQVKGPKGLLVQKEDARVELKVDGKKLLTQCRSQDIQSLALQGTYNALLKNMITGVTVGFEKELELVGVGYRAQMQGKKLSLQVGYSQPVEYEQPEGIEITVTGNTRVKIKGTDRQKVGQVAAQIRGFRKVEPYKGKGIKYLGEIVRRKAGKAAKATSAAGGA